MLYLVYYAGSFLASIYEAYCECWGLLSWHFWYEVDDIRVCVCVRVIYTQFCNGLLDPSPCVPAVSFSVFLPNILRFHFKIRFSLWLKQHFRTLCRNL